MKRVVFALIAICSIFGVTQSMSQSSAYPNKPIHLVVGTGTGGSNDIIARAIALRMGEVLQQPVIVDNKPGVSGIVGMTFVAKSNPDGYTLLLANLGQALAPSMFEKLQFDSIKDFSPVGQIAAQPLVIVVSATSPVNTLQELVAAARAQPKSINFGSGGAGAPQHLAAELLKGLTGTDMVHVPYKGGSGAAFMDLIGGQIQFMVEPLAGASAQIQGGRVKALAVTSKQRVPSLPNVPTVEQAGVPGLEMSTWYGLLAPAQTPKEILDQLNVALVAALNHPSTRNTLLAQGATPVTGTPQAFMDLVVSETARWRPIVERAGLRAQQ